MRSYKAESLPKLHAKYHACESSGALIKTDYWAPSSVSDSIGLRGVGLRILISNKVPGDACTADWGPNSEIH